MSMEVVSFEIIKTCSTSSFLSTSSLWLRCNLSVSCFYHHQGLLAAVSPSLWWTLILLEPEDKLFYKLCWIMTFHHNHRKIVNTDSVVILVKIIKHNTESSKREEKCTNIHIVLFFLQSTFLPLYLIIILLTFTSYLKNYISFLHILVQFLFL